jgi:hypothetical protein
MRRLAALALLLLALPSPASAAPPPNDNRADAAALATFPTVLTATTAEATVERLDPQVSECGRVESTLWYRIDTAPDGRISVTVKGTAGVAPVVRIYRRTRSAIEEADCGSAPPGGSATASIEAVRGSGYLVLVGGKPNSADGQFELRAELFLPPANDRSGGAQRIPGPPGSVRGTTLGATGDDNDPEGCGIAGATVWYRIRAPRDGRILLRLTADGELDAALVVLERIRSGLDGVACGSTDRRGRAIVGFRSRRGATYLVAVGHTRGDRPGTFRLEALVSEAPESRSAGKALPHGGVRSTVHGLTDVNDVWRVSLDSGTTYRIGLSSSSACARVTLRSARRPGVTLASPDCGGYTTFTPGPDGGGRYVLEVVAGSEARTQPYRLVVAAAAADDLGVGLPLRNRARVLGGLDPARLDVRDLYHFDVERRSEVTLTLGGGSTFVLVRDDGRRIGTFSHVRRQLEPGRYVVAVTSTVGAPASRYSLLLLVREITTTALRLSAATVEPGTAVSLTPEISSAATGRVTIQIDRFDPFTGWHFYRLLRTTVGGSVDWTPPAEGRWRLRASFNGTKEASPSRGGYVHLLVQRNVA